MVVERRTPRWAEAARGVVLLTGLGLLAFAVAAVIATVTVALMD
jgi:hypothetical protein